MSIKIQKPTFDKISKIIQNLDAQTGLFLLKELSRKKTIIEKILTYNIPSHIFQLIFFFVSTLIITNCKLVNLIVGVSFFVFLVMTLLPLKKFYHEKKLLENILKWCESLYDTKKKFHAEVQGIAETHLKIIERRSLLILKVMPIWFYSDCLIITFGFAIAGYFLPENICPKFSLPLPLFLPFKHQETWTSFVITIFAQALLSIQISSLALFVFELFFCVAIHIFGVLDIIYDTVKKVKHEMLRNLKEFDEEESQSST